MRMAIVGLSCIFPTPDIQRTAEYYVQVLGFSRVDYLDVSEPHICLYRDDAEIILLRSNCSVMPIRQLYGYGYDAYLYTESTEELQRELLAKDASVVRPLQTTDYQNRELVVEDIDGRWLAFGVKVRPRERM